MRGSVPRATHIRYGGTQEDGAVLTREARGFHACVFQHEFDHHVTSHTHALRKAALNGRPRRPPDIAKTLQFHVLK